MTRMEKYYVVKRTKKKDGQFTEIAAMSLDEANAIFEIRHESDRIAMEEGEAFYIFQANEKLIFDDNHRLVFPKGAMSIIEKW